MQKKGAALRLARGEVGAVAGGGGSAPASLSAGSGRAEAEAAPPLPDFTPVPRKYRHDGWTPARQRAFIEALADTGCVTRAARMVNMAQANCYTLRRAPGAEGFRRAWDAALDLGLKRLKDVAFERAIEGELVPVFAGGKLMGFRRKRNDALLMFVLRHYGRDGEGRRTTINYFSSRASAGVASGDGASSDSPHPNPSPKGEGLSVAEASTTTVRTVISGSADAQGGAEADDAAAQVLSGFDGVALDAEAQGAILAALEACAERARAANEALARGGEEAADAAEDDPDEPFVTLPRNGTPYRGALEPPVELVEVDAECAEPDWKLLGAQMPEWERD